MGHYARVIRGVILVLLLVLLTLVEEVVVRSTEQKVAIQANLAVLVEVVLKNVLLELVYQDKEVMVDTKTTFGVVVVEVKVVLAYLHQTLLVALVLLQEMQIIMVLVEAVVVEVVLQAVALLVVVGVLEEVDKEHQALLDNFKLDNQELVVAAEEVQVTIVNQIVKALTEVVV